MYHYKLADVLWNLGDRQGYQYHFKKSLEIDPYLHEARNDTRNQRMINESEGKENIWIGDDGNEDYNKYETEHVMKVESNKGQIKMSG